MPKVRDLAELNAYLRRCRLEDRQRIATGQTEPIGVRFERDCVAALPLPGHRFDACVHQPGRWTSTRRWGSTGNRYSVPRRCAPFRPVTVKGYVERVEVVADGQRRRRPPRCYERGQQVLDPLHYLATLGRKPAALDHSAGLPPLAAAAELRCTPRRRWSQHGPRAGARHYIRVLQLLGEHPIERVEQAIERLPAEGPLRPGR